MRRVVNNLISVIYSLIRFSLMKLCNWSDFHVDWIERISPNVVVRIGRGGKLKLGKMVRIHSGSKVSVGKNGVCEIQDNVKVNYNCMIVCFDRITIGEGTEFGPSVYIYDHDHEFSREFGAAPDAFTTAPVAIGKNVWIGAGSIILKGTTIGDGSVIGAGSVIKGSIPAHSRVIQKRCMEITELK